MVSSEQERRQIEDPDYWRSIYPDFSISDNPFDESLEPFDISSEAVGQYVAQIRSEGYFATEPVVPKDIIQPLADCIKAVVSRGHRTNYALLYDQFFHVMGRLKNVLEPVLGPNYQLVPDEYEAFYIPAENGATGAPPHRDTLGPGGDFKPDGTPTLINVWIPLVDVTTLHSCIYVLPGHLDPDYPSPAHDRSAIAKNRSVEKLMQDVRAVPARAGSILCWSPHVVHWGGRSSVFAATPRISIAVYYQSSQVPAVHPVTMGIPAPIPFEYRLYLCDKHYVDPEGRESSRFKAYQSAYYQSRG